MGYSKAILSDHSRIHLLFIEREGNGVDRNFQMHGFRKERMSRGGDNATTRLNHRVKGGVSMPIEVHIFSGSGQRFKCFPRSKEVKCRVFFCRTKVSNLRHRLTKRL